MGLRIGGLIGGLIGSLTDDRELSHERVIECERESRVRAMERAHTRSETRVARSWHAAARGVRRVRALTTEQAPESHCQALICDHVGTIYYVVPLVRACACAVVRRGGELDMDLAPQAHALAHGSGGRTADTRSVRSCL